MVLGKPDGVVARLLHHVDALKGTVENLSTGETLHCEPLPDHLMEMINAGGLMQHLRKKLKRED